MSIRMNKLHKQTEQQSQGKVLQQEEKEKKKNKYLIELRMPAARFLKDAPNRKMSIRMNKLHTAQRTVHVE